MNFEGGAKKSKKVLVNVDDNMRPNVKRLFVAHNPEKLRMGKDALSVLTKHACDEVRALSKRAYIFMDHANRKTLKKEDVMNASKHKVVIVKPLMARARVARVVRAALNKELRLSKKALDAIMAVVEHKMLKVLKSLRIHAATMGLHTIRHQDAVMMLAVKKEMCGASQEPTLELMEKKPKKKAKKSAKKSEKKSAEKKSAKKSEKKSAKKKSKK